MVAPDSGYVKKFSRRFVGLHKKAFFKFLAFCKEIACTFAAGMV